MNYENTPQLIHFCTQCSLRSKN